MEKQEVSDVGTGDQQDEANRSRKNQQGWTDVRDEIRLKIANGHGDVRGRVEIARLIVLILLKDDFGFGKRLRAGDAGTQPADS
jgi:hypothetical protein